MDLDGDTLTIDSVTDGSSGTVTTDGNVVTYSPNNDFSGTDSFTYTISDTSDEQDTATVRITVNVLSLDFDQSIYILDHYGEVNVTDSSANTNPLTKQTISVTVNSTSDPTGFTVTLEETGIDTGQFRSLAFIVFSSNGTTSETFRLDSAIDDTIEARYSVLFDSATITDDTGGLPATAGTILNTDFQLTCNGNSDGDEICDEWENGAPTGLSI